MKTDWKTNDAEGRRLRRAFKRLAKKLEEVQTTAELVEIARAMAYLATAKTTLAKFEFEREVEARISELERVAGIAKRGKITP